MQEDPPDPEAVFIHGTVHPPAKDTGDRFNYGYDDLVKLCDVLPDTPLRGWHAKDETVLDDCGAVLGSFVPLKERDLHFVGEISGSSFATKMVKEQVLSGACDGASLRNVNAYDTKKDLLRPELDPIAVGLLPAALAGRPGCKILTVATAADMRALEEKERNGDDTINVSLDPTGRDKDALLLTVQDLKTRRRTGIKSIYSYPHLVTRGSMQKSDEKKADEKKADEKKPDEKKVEEKKADEKVTDSNALVEKAALACAKLKAESDEKDKRIKELEAQMKSTTISDSEQQKKTAEALKASTKVYAKQVQKIFEGAPKTAAMQAVQKRFDEMIKATTAAEQEAAVNGLVQSNPEVAHLVAAFGASEMEMLKQFEDEAKRSEEYKKKAEEETKKSSDLQEKINGSLSTFFTTLGSANGVPGLGARLGGEGVKRPPEGTKSDSPGSADTATPPPRKKSKGEELIAVLQTKTSGQNAIKECSDFFDYLVDPKS